MYKTVVNNNFTNKRQQTGYLCKKFIWERRRSMEEIVWSEPGNYVVYSCVTGLS